ncbi:GroES-like protein [Phaeosphaeriaceae sp. SRC1lsM3a]|nr:GroES-like protein [Stagonospora sp. SRC1lsM3a]
MGSRRNIALYVNEACSFEVRDDLGIPECGEKEILVQTVYSGVNPADVVHSLQLGIRSTVLGYDFSGKVVSSASNSKFKPGQFVAGYTPTSLGRPIKYGTHQDFLVCPEDMCFTVPDHIPMSHAAGLTTVAMTAADVVFNLFKLPLQSLHQTLAEHNNPGPFLIWGASTSVGICTLQFAKAIGCEPIFVTASASRHSELLELGASKCFDYASPTVVSDVKAAVRDMAKGNLRYALDAAGREPDSSVPSLLEQCVEDARTETACVIFRAGTRMPLAVRHMDVTFHLKGTPHPFVIPASPDDHWRAWEALHWAVTNYNRTFKLPWVRECSNNARDALEEVIAIATLGKGAGKVVIKHPLLMSEHAIDPL